MELLGFKATVICWDPLLGQVHQAVRVVSDELWKAAHATGEWPACEALLGWQCVVDITEMLRERGNVAYQRSIWSGIWTAEVSHNGQRGEISLDDLGTLIA